MSANKTRPIWLYFKISAYSQYFYLKNLFYAFIDRFKQTQPLSTIQHSLNIDFFKEITHLKETKLSQIKTEIIKNFTSTKSNLNENLTFFQTSMHEILNDLNNLDLIQIQEGIHEVLKDLQEKTAESYNSVNSNVHEIYDKILKTYENLAEIVDERVREVYEVDLQNMKEIMINTPRRLNQIRTRLLSGSSMSPPSTDLDSLVNSRRNSVSTAELTQEESITVVNPTNSL